MSSKASIDIRHRLVFNRNDPEIKTKKNNMHGRLYVADGAMLSVDEFIFRPGCRITIYKNAKLVLKSGYMNYESTIECYNSIEIGEGCVISERVQIRDSNNHIIDRDGYVESAPIIIGNHVWIGLGVIILPGVTIGDNAVIAAGAVVSHNVPQNTLVAGVPAKVVRENVVWK